MASASTKRPGHIPVLARASLELLALREGLVVVDCTAGGGGHLGAFAQAVGPSGRVIGLDRDARAFADDAAGGVARAHSNVTLVRAAFCDVRRVLDELRIERVDALFADLGVSSFQLDEAARGFSFRADAPLDMRMDTTSGETAAELIARLPEGELADVIYRYGEEHGSRRVARAVKRAMPTTTKQLADIVAGALGGVRGRIHPATKTFQALRIAVNGELDQLQTLLGALDSVVKPGGRAGFLTFHSLEDRLVKRAMRGDTMLPVNKKSAVADEAELAQNPRSRSARLRVAIVGPSPEQRTKKNKYARDSDDHDDGGDDAPADDDTSVDAADPHARAPQENT